MKFGIKMHKENSNRLGAMHKSVVTIFGNFWEFSISVPVFPLHRKGFFPIRIHQMDKANEKNFKRGAE